MTTDSWNVTPDNTFEFTAHSRQFGVHIALGAMGDFAIALLELVGTAWTSLDAVYDQTGNWNDGINAAGGLEPFAANMVTALNALISKNAFPVAPAPGDTPTDWSSFALWLIGRLVATETAAGVTLGLK